MVGSPLAGAERKTADRFPVRHPDAHSVLAAIGAALAAVAALVFLAGLLIYLPGNDGGILLVIIALGSFTSSIGLLAAARRT